MARALWLSGIATLCALGTLVPVVAEDYPKKAYMATFQSTGPSGESSMRSASDGKGKTMTEMTSGRMHVISIFDYPSKVSMVINPAAKRIMKMRLTDDQKDSMSRKPPNSVSLGSKVIDGHPCKGWQSNSPSGKMEVWLADDIDLAVKMVVTTPVGTKTTVLKTYAPGMPPAGTFTPPAGFAVMEVPSSPPVN